MLFHYSRFSEIYKLRQKKINEIVNIDKKCDKMNCIRKESVNDKTKKNENKSKNCLTSSNRYDILYKYEKQRRVSALTLAQQSDYG